MLTAAAESAFAGVVGAVRGAPSRVSGEVSVVVSSVQGAINSSLVSVRGHASGAVSSVVSAVQGAVDEVKAAVAAVVATLRALLDDAIASVTSTISAAVGSVRSAVSGLGGNVSAAASALLTDVLGAASGIGSDVLVTLGAMKDGLMDDLRNLTSVVTFKVDVVRQLAQNDEHAEALGNRANLLPWMVRLCHMTLRQDARAVGELLLPGGDHSEVEEILESMKAKARDGLAKFRGSIYRLRTAPKAWFARITT